MDLVNRHNTIKSYTTSYICSSFFYIYLHHHHACSLFPSSSSSSIHLHALLLLLLRRPFSPFLPHRIFFINPVGLDYASRSKISYLISSQLHTKSPPPTTSPSLSIHLITYINALTSSKPERKKEGQGEESLLSLSSLPIQISKNSLLLLLLLLDSFPLRGKE